MEERHVDLIKAYELIIGNKVFTDKKKINWEALIDEFVNEERVKRIETTKDLPTIYKDLVPLLEDIKDWQRQARKILEQFLKLNLITGNLEVRKKGETNGNRLISSIRNHRTLRTYIYESVL